MEEEKKDSLNEDRQKAEKYYEMIKRKRRHQAKSYGVKSVFTSGGKTIVTGYEAQNKSSVEAEFLKTEEDPGWKEEKNEKTKFDASKEKKPSILVKPINAEGKSHSRPVEVADPSFASNKNGAEKPVGMDQLRLKGELEKYYFGEEFPNDNIHIQIIYNILDVKKLFCLYSNEMVGVLNNIISRVEGESSLCTYRGNDKDYIGAFDISSPRTALEGEENEEMSTRKGETKYKHYLVFRDFLKALQPYNIFFDEIFKFRKKDEEKAVLELNEMDSYNWNVIRACAFIRNYFCHFEYKSGDADIVMALSKNKDVKKAIDEYAAKRLHQIETTFVKDAKRNMEILLWALDRIDLEINTDAASRKPVIQERLKSFYEFSIEKRGKNLGLRIPSIKEALKEKVSLEPADLMKHPERKGKFDNLLEYIIYLQIKDNVERQQKVVASLRASQTDEEKEAIYKEVADQLYEENADTFNAFKKSFDENIAVEGDKDWLFDPESPDFANMSLDNSKSASNDDYAFRNILIFLSAFLEQKECNELVTSLINKFENILSLYEVAKKNDLSIKLSEKTKKMFGRRELQKTVDGLYAIQGCFKLKKQFNGETKINLFADALNIFKTDDFFRRSINKEGDIEENESYHGFIKPMIGATVEWEKKLKNYVRKNIVESRRFWYLVRYVKPTEVRLIMNNDKLVEYTLSRLPDTQIDRYCKSCELKGPNKAEKIASLMKGLKDLTFDNLVYGKLKKVFENGDIEGRRPIGALIGLYLTVAYLIVKNMVQVNARYMLAYACFQRDYFFFNNHEDPERSEDFKNIAIKFLEEHRFDKNKHVKEMIEKNRAEYESLEKEMPNVGLAKEHRNKIEHLNYLNYLTEANDIRSVRSYYDVYQYIVQKYWAKKKGLAISPERPMFSAMKENLEKYHLPQEDFVKIINFPLSYCVPRYKNLTISFLFNARNEEPRD